MAFKMDGKLYNTMMDIARELGRARIKRQDFKRFGIVEVDNSEVEEVEEVETEEVTVEEVETAEITEDAGLDKDDMLERDYPGVSESEEVGEEIKPEESTEEVEPEEPKEEEEEKEEEKRKERRERKKKERKEAKKPTPEMLEKAKELREKAGYSDDIWDWAVDIRKRTSEEVFAICGNLGLEWNRHETPRIDRMRAVMTLRENLYPGQKRPKVRKSAWTGIPNTEIEELCKKHNVEYPDTKDDRVKRMHMIKALKGAGVERPE